MKQVQYIKKLEDLEIDQYEFADYRHLYKLKELAMSYVCVKPNCSVPAHVHDNEEQTYWIVEGEGIVRINDKEFEVGEHQAVYIPLGSEHTIKNTSKKPLKYIFFAAII